MLRRLLGNLAPSIDRMIERIPPHIRDIIQKASLAFAALLALIVIISGVNKGLREAQPTGVRLVERSRDLFYLQEMREEYAKKRKLVEDVEVDPLEFPSRQKAADETQFTPMGRDTMGHLMGEKEEMLKHEDALRPKEKSPGYLGDSALVPRLTPDKKTIDDQDTLLSRDKIGSQKPAPEEKPAIEPMLQPGASPARVNAARQRDVFDEVDSPRSQPAPAPKTATPPPKKGKFEYMD
ncbi:hypothetical protein [Turneriella parva]|uniref:Uncharacterized protein n=1 Tax=Turneriella parva (strain ATCC BAA-1111 / DSM 21527 / NCTC 11395 / H) TaxID=869212 RepID=I4B8T0_TURPD|nr:hypothetical protein [Turneriella parva]AFM13687.1 hypothetical protein Turpa_3048 [Turneriella parva DSM 21527]